MKRKAGGASRSADKKNGMIDFNYANVSYQIDPSRRKVYHRWIEVETARTCLIIGAWNHSQAPAKKGGLNRQPFKHQPERAEIRSSQPT